MPRNKCPGCNEVIEGPTSRLNHHYNTCELYQATFSDIPTGVSVSNPASTASTGNAAAAASHLLSSTQKLAQRLRLKRKVGSKKKDLAGGTQNAIAPAQAEESELNLPGDEYSMHIDQEGTPSLAETMLDPMDAVPAAPMEKDPNTTGLSRQSRPNRGKLPARYVQDILPGGPAPLPEEDEIILESTPLPPVPRRFLQLGRGIRLRLTETVRTAANAFGLSRLYYGRPTSVPDAFSPTEDILQTSAQENPSQSRPATPDPETPPRMTLEEAIAPYPNYSAYLFNSLHWDGDKKTKDSRRNLQAAISDPLFRAEDIAGVNFNALDEKLARSTSETSGTSFESPVASDPQFGRGWKRSAVHIQVPHGQKKTSATCPSDERCRFTIPDIMHRSIPDVVCDAFAQPSGKRLHTTPFREYWKNPHTDKTETVYGEFYSSSAFIEANDEVQALPPEPNCQLPRAVAGVFMASDSAHLTDTGDAKIHPFNVIVPNQSKYDYAKPSMESVYPVMYLQPMPETINDFVNEIPGSRTKAPGHPIFAHCRREYYHAALRLVFDNQFWEMYKHGRVVKCADGVVRRLYLRLFVYSADYPEKVLVATIRDGGKCPCPRCLVKEEDLHKMGTEDDMETRNANQRVDDAERRAKVKRARNAIYRDGVGMANRKVEDELKDESYVPTENALSVTIDGVALDVFSILVVDLMHEIELGVWIGLLAHLIRILHTLGSENIRILNARFRDVPPFGQDAIRTFRANVAKMTRMTADGYANMLQCAIPCFEGLFPEPYNSEILSLLFTLARWHSLAKLRLHSDSTLLQLEQITKDFGNAIRNFQNGCCEHFKTVETPEENAKRVKAIQAAQAAGKRTTGSTNSGRQQKKYSTSTYKYHAMGDYVKTIARIGTTDGYTTAINERSHRAPISAFQRTSKHNYEGQIANIGSIKEAHREIQARLQQLKSQGDFPDVASGETVDATSKRRADRDAVVGDGRTRYIIAQDEATKVDLRDLRREYSMDPAYEDFTDRLRDHILARLLGRSGVSELFPNDEREELRILGSHIYEHARVRFNYTTYDMKRGQDCVSWKTKKCHIMLLSDDEPASEDEPAHPFWYARVIGVYHAKVQHRILAPKPRRFDFLHVRWFGIDPENAGGWAKRRLDKVGYVPQPDPDAFGFLDPAQVLRGCHLVPAYADGRTKDLLGPSVVRDSATDGDWRYYYVMRFSDRDLMMRYTGLGIGHATNIPRWIDFSEPTLEAIIEAPEVSAEDSVDGDEQEERSHMQEAGDRSDAENEVPEEYTLDDWTTWDPAE